MESRVSKARRKAVRDDLRRKELRDAEAKLPASRSDLNELFDWVDAKLENEGCDHTLKHTTSFITQK
jgi:hypothetical protein